MPLYEYRKNATNHLTIPRSIRQEIVCGTRQVLDHLFALIRERTRSGQAFLIAIDGWYGVNWTGLESGLRDAAQAHGVAVEVLSAAHLFKSPEEIEAYRRPFETDDPAFGYVNSGGILEDILDPSKVAALKARLAARKEGQVELLVVIGPGAAISALEPLYDLRLYADFTMQPLLWQMWDGKLVTFGSEVPTTHYQ